MSRFCDQRRGDPASPNIIDFLIRTTPERTEVKNKPCRGEKGNFPRAPQNEDSMLRPSAIWMRNQRKLARHKDVLDPVRILRTYCTRSCGHRRCPRHTRCGPNAEQRHPPTLRNSVCVSGQQVKAIAPLQCTRTRTAKQLTCAT
jgi:hypothetical protein